ncbi:UDP-glycosyltransferase 87A1 [Platanthera zijinensis]|uniref:Glycosyltransferase n=1 Tax=Platanthera zijinensis TaxID=2320716 RepID=A0AAP0FT73_9ASPA
MDSIHPTEAAAACRTCHIAAIPYPGRGHMNPMMNLCRLLDGRDNITVTVIVTDEWLNLLSSETSPPNLKSNVQLRSIPNVLPSERSRGDNYTEFMNAVFTKMSEPVGCLLDGLDPPADVVVADALLLWVVDLCKQRNLPVVALWTESASVLWALNTFERLHAAGQLPADFSGHKALAYLPNVSTPRLANFQMGATDFDILRSFVRKYYWFRTTAHSLIMSSFDELESSAMDEIRSEFSLPIYQVGPLIPHMLLPAIPSLPDYFSWLDSRPKSSVLYVSLGSFLPISASQMDEIVAGLAGSGIPFLLVSRDSKLCRPDGVEGSAGLVVPWCDQLRVLRHPSVGGFLTHCGWNSTLEALYAGVPMIAFPLFWDQEPNSKLVVEEWGIGRRLKDKDENLTSELTASKVKRFMDLDDEESKCMRDRSEKMKEICWEALNAGGSSQNLQGFLDQITNKCC